MTTQFLAILAAAGLVTAGVSATAETRSAAAIPAASMVSVAKGRIASGAVPARQGGRPDCRLEENRNLPACAAQGGAGGGGVSGGVLAALAAGVGAAGLFVALKNDSNG